MDLQIKKELKTDINDLMQDFEQTNSIRFIDFSRVWRDHSFSYIFTYKLNESDLREFIEEIYEIVLDKIQRSVKPENAIFVLYFIYCLYMCQPIEPKIPIKLDLTKFKAFRHLFQESSRHKHIDVCYIWMKLLSLGAFHLAAQMKPFGPLTMKKSPLPGSSSSNGNFSLDHLQELESEMEDLKNLHHAYLTLKENLEGPDATPIKEMTLVRDDLFREFKNTIESLESSTSCTKVKEQ